MQSLQPRQRLINQNVDAARQLTGPFQDIQKRQPPRVFATTATKANHGHVFIPIPVGMIGRIALWRDKAQDDLCIPAITAALQMNGRPAFGAGPRPCAAFQSISTGHKHRIQRSDNGLMGRLSPFGKTGVMRGGMLAGGEVFVFL